MMFFDGPSELPLPRGDSIIETLHTAMKIAVRSFNASIPFKLDSCLHAFICIHCHKPSGPHVLVVIYCTFYIFLRNGLLQVLKHVNK